jgi:hypothetical protein
LAHKHSVYGGLLNLSSNTTANSGVGIGYGVTVEIVPKTICGPEVVVVGEGGAVAIEDKVAVDEDDVVVDEGEVVVDEGEVVLDEDEVVLDEDEIAVNILTVVDVPNLAGGNGGNGKDEDARHPIPPEFVCRL